MRKLILAFALISIASALTCYNGMKLLRMQGVGTTTTECSSGSYCYNMTASAYLMVDFVKAGCSTYRCMLAPNQCISTYFQLIPVSLCCCSHDRCNVGGNPVYSDNPQSITGGDGYNYGGGNNNNDNKNQGGSGYDYNYGGNNNNNNNNNNNQGGNNWGSGYNYGGGSGSGSNTPTNQGGRKFSAKEIEDRFRDYDVDHRGDNNGGGGEEESFQKINAFTTPRPGRIGGGGAPSRQGSSTSQGGEIEILGDEPDNNLGSRFNGGRRSYTIPSRRGSDYNGENRAGSAWGGEYDRKFSQQRPENNMDQEISPYNDENQPGSAWGSEYDQKFGSSSNNYGRNTPGYGRDDEEDDGRVGSAWGGVYDRKFEQNDRYQQNDGYNSADYNNGRQEPMPNNGYRDASQNNDEGREIEI